MPNVTEWIIRKSGINYTIANDGAEIILRTNQQSEALIPIDNTLSSAPTRGVFASEDEIELYIGSVIAANKMMVGYIDVLPDTRNPDRSWAEVLHIEDWTSYLAAKTIYETIEASSVTRTKTASQILTSSAAEIAGLATNITALNTAAEEMKRSFNGTYVKDAWLAAAENAGADFFGDETKTLQAFLHGARNLTEVGTGLIYKIKDIPSVSADTLMVEHQFQYQFAQDATQRYRTVVATNGIIQGFPQDPNQFQIQQIKHDQNGKIFSKWFRHFGGLAEWDIDTTTRKPVDFFSATDIGGIVIPTIKLNIDTATMDASTFLQGAEYDKDGNIITEDMGLAVTDYLDVQFFIKLSLSGATVNHVIMRLYDGAGSGNYWERDIIGDLIGGGAAWTVVRYRLPANTVDSPSNGWTKVGTPVAIDACYLQFENGAAVIDGYTAGSYVQFGQFQFIRRQRVTVTGAGTPATEKIIIDATMKSQRGLETLAAKEQARVNVIANTGFFTILGNQAFKKPGYNIQVDFTNTMGSGRSGTVRIEEIKHFLKNGKYYTEVHFSPAFQRP